jgi:antitoxin component YwqK of YwqJK toxin-antitoxin module
LYSNGQKKSESIYKDGKLDGVTTYWHTNGQKKSKSIYKDGKMNRLTTGWYENGQKNTEGNFKDGKRDGLHTTWYKSGQKKSELNFKGGQLWTAVAWKPNGEKCPDTNIFDGNGIMVAYNDKGTEVGRVTYKDGEIVSN